MKAKNRIFGLDVMRSVAILCVLFAHSFVLILPESTINFNRFFGFFGVEVFFVLSGFLIGNILIKLFDKKEVKFKEVKRFWIRRWFRTLPNYYLFLVIYFVMHLTDLIPTNITVTEIFEYLFFLQNSYSPHPGFFAVAWSLSIEEWFYMLFPLVALVIYKWKGSNSAVLYTILFFILGCLLCRVVLAMNFELGWSNWFRKMTLWRLDSIAMGVLVAYFMKKHADFFKKRQGVLLSIGILGLIALLIPFWNIYVINGASSFFFETIFFTLISLSLALVIPSLATWRLNNQNIISKAITHTSLISYSLYLSHWLVVIILYKYFPELFGVISLTLFLVFSFVISHIIYTYFERPMMNLRDRFS